MLRAGSQVTFDVQGSTGGMLPVDDTDLRNALISKLAAFFQVVNIAIVKGSMVSNIIDFQWFHWNYSATVTIVTRMDYGDVTDLRGVIANAFYDAGGAIPTVTVRGVDMPQGPAVTNTGIGVGSLLAGSGVLVALVAVAAVAILVKVK